MLYMLVPQVVFYFVVSTRLANHVPAAGKADTEKVACVFCSALYVIWRSTCVIRNASHVTCYSVYYICNAVYVMLNVIYVISNSLYVI